MNTINRSLLFLVAALGCVNTAVSLVAGPTLEYDCDRWQKDKDYNEGGNNSNLRDHTVENSAQDCLYTCEATYGCNSVTFQSSTGNCWPKMISPTENIADNAPGLDTIRLCEKVADCGFWVSAAWASQYLVPTPNDQTDPCLPPASPVSRKQCLEAAQSCSVCNAVTYTPTSCSFYNVMLDGPTTTDDPLLYPPNADYPENAESFKFCPGKQCGEWQQATRYQGPELSTIDNLRSRDECASRCLDHLDCAIASFKDVQNSKCKLYRDLPDVTVNPNDKAKWESVICSVPEDDDDDDYPTTMCDTWIIGRYPNNNNCELHDLHQFDDAAGSRDDCGDLCNNTGFDFCSYNDGSGRCQGFSLVPENEGSNIPRRPGACFVRDHQQWMKNWESAQICNARAQAHKQCAGDNDEQPPVPMTPKECVEGYECVEQNEHYSQCMPLGTPPPPNNPAPVDCVPEWGQCGGSDANGKWEHTCCSGSTCHKKDQWYSQCAVARPADWPKLEL